MVQTLKANRWTSERLLDRVVRYADLEPCYDAFVDCRTPGSEAKENFTIIGPGVSENPAQHVHIAEPHGFNIGGARQPPGCVNSRHSHNTAEVFVVHTGLDVEKKRLEEQQRRVQREIKRFQAGDRIGRDELHDRAVR